MSKKKRLWVSVYGSELREPYFDGLFLVYVIYFCVALRAVLTCTLKKLNPVSRGYQQLTNRTLTEQNPPQKRGCRSGPWSAGQVRTKTKNVK